MKKLIIVLLLVCFAVPYTVLAAEVKNLKVAQEWDKAVATYDLVGTTGEQTAEVTVSINVNGQRRISDQLHLSGDYGKNVSVGNGKRIVWNALSDLPKDFDGDINWMVTTLGGENKNAKGWLGVSIQTVTHELALSFGVEGEKGALVNGVIIDSPAKKAGLKSGDIIVELDGKQIHEMKELLSIVSRTPPGKNVTVNILRNGKLEAVKVTIGQLKEVEENAQIDALQELLNMTVSVLNTSLAAELGINETKGVVVVAVRQGGLAKQTGIATGDVIQEINGMRINTLVDFTNASKTYKSHGATRFLLRRGGNSLFIAVKVE